jgi:hypothetical protein
VDAQASDVNLDTEPGDEEISIQVNASHMFSGLTPEQAPGFTWQFPLIDNRGSTGWKTIGVFPPDHDCDRLQTIILTLGVREKDALSDDQFMTEPSAFQTGPLRCGAMHTAFTNGQFGLHEELPAQTFLLMRKDQVRGAVGARTRVYVISQ